MLDNTVVRVEALGKSYIIGRNLQDERGREFISRGARAFIRKLNDAAHGRPIIGGDRREVFWALKDVEFSVGRGEVVGIIGKNGAGKSTLLKILARITEPTTGRVEITGRVACLLQVGTGFHPELTGKENIYLNGAVLGMRRREINDKFAEIVAFSEVGQFIDTPVKRYSSGMYVRLAFSVAAYLTADILIVDEVLALGDAEFQRKCLGAMSKIAAGGRTILYVSHNAGSVRALCTRGVVLEAGRVKYDGPVDDALEVYGDTTGP